MSTTFREGIERSKRMLAGKLEMSLRVREARTSQPIAHVDLQPPSDYRDPVTGRQQLQPSPDLVAAGDYFRRARLRSNKSQEQLARESGVSQSMISRFERGLAPGMRIEKLVALAAFTGRVFPFGTCPHEHDCAWQPRKSAEYQASQVAALIATILGSGAREESDDETPLEPDEVEERHDFFGVTRSQIQSPLPD